jgi:hypothetical protein
MMILFNHVGNPYPIDSIEECITKFKPSYTKTVQKIISTTINGIDKKLFATNVAMLMTSFMMTRSGPFKGVRLSNRKIHDPKNTVADCWDAIGGHLTDVKAFIQSKVINERSRFLVEISDSDLNYVIANIWDIFKKLLPVCMTENSLGLVGLICSASRNRASDR